MSFEIQKGLFLLDFTDHHAALGLPVNADASQVRKRYLRVARKLHPDSLIGSTAAEKRQATEVLSKLVNPAYEMLSQEKHRKEYLLTVRLKGQQAQQQQASLTHGLGEEAQTLVKAPNLDAMYQQMVTALSSRQFEDLGQLTGTIATLSELNLVYLMRKHGKGQNATQSASQTASAGGDQTAGPAATRPPGEDGRSDSPPTIIQNQAHQMSLADGYLRRAEEYLRKKAHSQAILELRDGLRAAPKDSRCHSLMGIIYLQQNQATMAKVSIRKALELNPKDLRAIEGRRKLATMGHKITIPGEAVPSPGEGTTRSAAASKSKGTNGKSTNGKSKGGGGLFGGIFGGGKSKRK